MIQYIHPILIRYEPKLCTTPLWAMALPERPLTNRSWPLERDPRANTLHRLFCIFGTVYSSLLRRVTHTHTSTHLNMKQTHKIAQVPVRHEDHAGQMLIDSDVWPLDTIEKHKTINILRYLTIFLVHSSSQCPVLMEQQITLGYTMGPDLSPGLLLLLLFLALDGITSPMQEKLFKEYGLSKSLDELLDYLDSIDSIDSIHS